MSLNARMTRRCVCDQPRREAMLERIHSTLQNAAFGSNAAEVELFPAALLEQRHTLRAKWTIDLLVKRYALIYGRNSGTRSMSGEA